jgi:hypothetical protein
LFIVRRGNVKLMGSQRQIVHRADEGAHRAAAEANRADDSTAIAAGLAAKLRELGVDPDVV